MSSKRAQTEIAGVTIEVEAGLVISFPLLESGWVGGGCAEILKQSWRDAKKKPGCVQGHWARPGKGCYSIGVMAKKQDMSNHQLGPRFKAQNIPTHQSPGRS